MTLDTMGHIAETFGSDGLLSTRLKQAVMLLDASGSLEVAGWADTGAVVAKWRNDGQVDTDFGSNGNFQLPTGFVTGLDTAEIGISAVNGDLLIAGEQQVGTEDGGWVLDSAVNVVSDSDQPEPNSSSSTFVHNFGGNDILTNVRAIADGTVVVAGGHGTESSPDSDLPYVVRVSSAGVIESDLSAGVTGLVAGRDWRVALAPDGGFFLAMSTGTTVRVLRIDPSGTIAGDSGELASPVSDILQVSTLRYTTDGLFVLANGGSDVPALLGHFDNQAVPDPAFGPSGFAALPSEITVGLDVAVSTPGVAFVSGMKQTTSTTGESILAKFSY